MTPASIPSKSTFEESWQLAQINIGCLRYNLYAILLQSYGDDWQVIDIGPDMSPVTSIQAGINWLPLRSDR